MTKSAPAPAIGSPIESIETMALAIPFDDGSGQRGPMPRRWTHFDTVLVRVETEDGTVGWGESFSYFCRSTVVACINDMVAPLVVGRRVDDIAALSAELQLELHLLGRYGIVMFALSGVETALWDIAAKRRGVSLAEYLGGRRRDTVPAYASLVRYGDAGAVTEFAKRAIGEGYRDVKLHEIALAPIEAGRVAIGGEVRLTTDVNCRWSLAEAERMLPAMKELDLFWVEEPVFPCDHAPTLQALARFGVPLATGENASTSIPFEATVAAVAHVQPSVTKVGGISEFLKVIELANAHGRTPMPHSPYFGPGYWATLQLAAHRPEIGLFEHYYVKPEAYVSQSIPLPKAGLVTIPSGPGLGFEPDMGVLERYRVAG